MSEASVAAKPAGATGSATTYDAVVIGAGVAGLYQVYRLREMGMSVLGIEAGSGVGGTWYWNRYPGARFDSEAEIYQYWFDEAMFKNWQPTERFPAQPETERWLNYVADRTDLRKYYSFDTRVTAAHYDEAGQQWRVETDRGDTVTARFLICCTGMLSAPLSNIFEGQDSFKGQIFHTARWPKERVEFVGKRVGVVGTGATGIQVIQTIAPQVGHMKVFLRTPQYIIPMRNPKYTPADWAQQGKRFSEIRDRVQGTFSGFEYDFDNGVWADLTPAQRTEVLERLWADGSLALWLSSFAEMFFDEKVNDVVSEFVREKMRARIKDPDLCAKLIPTSYGFGTHRVPLESNYLEVFHQPNVEIVDVKASPIVRIVPEGVMTADGTVHELDILVLATGFNAGSGALTRIDIRGRDGRSLKEEWGQEIRTAMGLQVHGYPNLFTTGAPLAPSAALCNMTTCLQQQVGWISDCIRDMREKGLKVIEASRESQDQWVAHHDEIANKTLVVKTDSWYMGSNVSGKPRRLLSYIGGVGTYRQKCADVAASGYSGFKFA
ncbi:NAD(P)/FAD-dependent oxidoreductase [Methyloversatilis sp. XJ19-13]|uniref:flavin-containing monooxygenase n=1 Tax=Methyloversatilis sp. XJ19-13 TaxID=2963430 RepID=UPI00211C0129|nr:NAD(P)/FAD-dependent oxidoreductase [Methyloversatilis sp. XJ19-13]MCQ9374207.1 NAD(P)/FAD-dependent oxidoreductase [Methyloversatilis sp. XJ19-13]